MQVLSDLIPITNGEVFDIIRRNREQRNIKALPHFHAQSIASITGSSAYQALALNSRFAHREQMQKQREGRAAAAESGAVQLIPATVLSSSYTTTGGGIAPQLHNIVPHTEVKVLHYLQRERDFYGPSSVVLRRFDHSEDYQESEGEEDENEDDNAGGSANKKKSSTDEDDLDAQIKEILDKNALYSPKPLAFISRDHHEKIERGEAEVGSSPFPPGTVAATGPPPSDPAVPSLFHHESRVDNVAALDRCLLLLREYGQSQTAKLVSSLKDKCFTGAALVRTLEAAWAEQTQADKQLFANFLVSMAQQQSSASQLLLSVDKAVIERGVAKRLSGADGSAASAAAASPTAASAVDQQILIACGMPVAPLVLRNLIDLRHSLKTSAAHVAAVIPNELRWMGDLAEFVLRYELVRKTEEIFKKNGSSSGGNHLDDAFTGSSSAAHQAAFPPRYSGGVEDPSISLPAPIVEGFRYSAVMAICTSILEAMAAFK